MTTTTKDDQTIRAETHRFRTIALNPDTPMTREDSERLLTWAWDRAGEDLETANLNRLQASDLVADLRKASRLMSDLRKRVSAARTVATRTNVVSIAPESEQSDLATSDLEQYLGKASNLLANLLGTAEYLESEA
jgi:hypothetical protein